MPGFVSNPRIHAVLAAYFVPPLIIFTGVNFIAHWRLGRPTPFILTAASGHNALIASLANPMIIGMLAQAALPASLTHMSSLNA